MNRFRRFLRAVIKIFRPGFIYRRWKTKSEWLYYNYFQTIRTRTINLQNTLSYGEANVPAGNWAELTGDMQRASMLLAYSPHVGLLEKYQVLDERLFLGNNFEQTAYFSNAMDCVKIIGHYFGHTTAEGIRDQARSFITLYERVATGDSSEVKYATSRAHSRARILPSVRSTWTPGTYLIDDGMHRLAIAWVLGHRKTNVIVLPTRPTKLQFLVTSVAKSQKWQGLYQPIDTVDFDNSWPLVRRCRDRFEMMLKFLTAGQYHICELSVADLGCAYGWFVAEFSKQGCNSVGVDIDFIRRKSTSAS